MNKLAPFILLLLLGAGCMRDAMEDTEETYTPSDAPVVGLDDVTPQVVDPLTDLKDRGRKVTFGLYVTPQTFPVEPKENFTGYHTARDYEIFTDELNADVPVNAICEGSIVKADYVSGYGGVVVEACTLNGEDITVIYGHLDQASFTYNVNDTVPIGKKIGILGDDHSSETDGARKHLHLGIHKGPALELRGYVQQQNLLSGWLDPDVVLGY
jgi:hypothetical protein